jgi:adenine-specific DNA-methyltransferase
VRENRTHGSEGGDGESRFRPLSAEDRPNQFYDITNPRTHVKYPGNPNRVWRFEPDMMKKVIGDELVIWPDEQKDGDMTRPRYKTYFDPNNPKIKPLSSWVESSTRSKAEISEEAEDYESEILTSGMNAEGGRVLYRIFGKKLVDYPKPPSLIKALVRAASSKDDLILDSFAGSGTSGHAVLELNREDGGSRKFILVQLPYDTKENENDKFNICRQVTAERVRRVIHGYTYKTPKGNKEDVDGLGGSFTYALIGKPLFGEYRDWGKQLPAYEELAKYIFYTETSQEFDRKSMNEKTGKIGEHHGTSYYLLYTPNGEEDRRLDTDWLKALDKTEKNRKIVVYCEKKWIHPDDLARYEVEANRTVRTMIVPSNLK